MRLIGRFARDRSANMATMLALLVVPLVSTVGLAVDFGRVYFVRSQTQSALDAAALAAGRVAQVETTDKMNKASAAASAFFNHATSTDVVTSTLEFSPNSEQTSFTLSAKSWVRTPFLGALNSWFQRPSLSGAPAQCEGNLYGCVTLTTTATSELKTGGESGSNVELALMMDVTGSMCSPCTKIDDAKLAAKDLIDIVIWSDQSLYTSKIALAPFAAAVNGGIAFAPLMRGTVTSNVQASPQVLDMASTSSQPTDRWIQFPKATGGNACSGTNCTWQISTKCVTERIGAERYTDAPPSAAYLGKAYFGSGNPDQSCVIANYTDAEVNSIQPLSNDRTMLKRRIDKLKTGGSTGGHLGTAWAWYLLSPKWNYLFPAESAAAPYADLTTLSTKGAPKLRKIAVLMTDGDYNINYCKGVEAKNSDQSPDINCASENGKALAQAISLCAAMKDPLEDNVTKIEVFTIGFQVSSASKTFLQDCATDANHFYDATTGDALRAAFRDIALKISTLRLSN